MREIITFALNNRIERVSGLSGDTTLLNWLRSTRRLTGSKEGCAEGDCGTCTVVIARRDAGGVMRWHPVNACIQFMGMLEGASVTTIEGIKPEIEVKSSNSPKSGKQSASNQASKIKVPDMHPCQQVMVDHHGSQCGFCTPGFVMSLFAAWCNGSGLDADTIDTTLAGNLCRCTGYRPIVEAALALKVGSVFPEYETYRRKTEAAIMAAIAHDETVCLSDGRRRFIAPATVKDFAANYAENQQATIVSGATDVGLWVTKMNRDLPVMIWTGRVHGFDKMEKIGAHWHIGPAVTHAAAMSHLAKGKPDFGEVMRRFGSLQVRSSGTLCGNIANGSPIGDMPPMLIALAAEIELSGVDSNRRMPLESFFLGYGKQYRDIGEFVSGLLVPTGDAPYFRAYKISKRFDQDISAVLGAFNIAVAGARITSARLAFGGMAATPSRAHNAEAILTDAPLTLESFTAAAHALDDDFAPISDMRASAEYRMQVAKNLVLKYGMDCLGGAVPRLTASSEKLTLDSLVEAG